MGQKITKYHMAKIRKERAEIVKRYAQDRKSPIQFQDALDEVIEAGLKVKRLMPTEDELTPAA